MNRRQFLRGLAGMGAVLVSATNAVSGVSGVFSGLRKKPLDLHWAIEPKFAYAGEFSNGLARVIPKGQEEPKYGYIDITGQFVIPPRFDDALSFGVDPKDRAYVLLNGMRGYILRDGSFHPESPALRRYAYSPYFRNGEPRPIVQRTEEQRKFTPFHELWAPGSGKTGFMSQDLQIAIEPQFDHAYTFNEGLVPVKRKDSCGYIDRTGRVALDFQYDQTSSFIEGFARVANGDRMMLINKTGEEIRGSETEEYDSFSEGLCAVRCGSGKCGYVDTSGKMLIEPRFDEAEYFYKGVAVVEVGGTWGLIDRDGTFVIVPRFHSLRGVYYVQSGPLPFSIRETIRTSSTKDSHSVREKYGYVDLRGEVVIPPVFDDACRFQEGLAGARIKDKWGYIDRNGQWAIPPLFDSRQDFSEGLVPARVGDTWGYLAKLQCDAG